MCLKHHVKLTNISEVFTTTVWTFNVIISNKIHHLVIGHTVDISFWELTFDELVRSETLLTVFAVNEGIIEC